MLLFSQHCWGKSCVHVCMCVCVSCMDGMLLFSQYC